jgi:hypothetical protein
MPRGVPLSFTLAPSAIAAFADGMSSLEHAVASRSDNDKDKDMACIKLFYFRNAEICHFELFATILPSHVNRSEFKTACTHGASTLPTSPALSKRRTLA